MFGTFCAFLYVIACCACASVTLSEKELECYSQEKVYHDGSDKCYKLLTKGPCEDGEWLTLAKDERRIRPVCVKGKCKEGEYYWPKTRQCIELKNKDAVCESIGEELMNNVFGEGACACTREPARVRIGGDKRSGCYQPYTRGPCNAGQIVAVPENETNVGVCVKDPCGGYGKKDAIFAPFENGTCYELGTQGPCSDDLVFKVHANLLKPSCTSLTTNIFSIQRPSNCYQDENGDCQKRVTNNRRSEAEKFQKELFNSIKNR